MIDVQYYHLLLFCSLLFVTNTTDTNNLLQQTVNAFNQKKFSKVISLLSHLKRTSTDPTSTTPATIQQFEYLGQSYAALGQEHLAADAYETLLALQARLSTPRSFLGLNGLGLILSRQGQASRAVDLLKEATTVAPTSHAVWNNYATVQHKHQKLKAAVRSYQKAWKLLKHKIYGYNLGNALMDIHHHSKAIVILRKVIHLDKTFAEAHWKLARCYVAENQFSKAVSRFRAALRHIKIAVKFNEAEVRFELHDAYLGLRIPKHQKAIKELEKAVQLEPHNAEYVFALEHLYRYTVNFGGLQRVQRRSMDLLSKELLRSPQQRSFLSPMRALCFLQASKMKILMSGWSNSMLQRGGSWRGGSGGGSGNSGESGGAIYSESGGAIYSDGGGHGGTSSTSLRIGFMSSEFETNSPMMHLMDRLPSIMSDMFDDVIMHVYALRDVQRVYPLSTSLSSMSSLHGVTVRRLNGMNDMKAAETIEKDALDYLIDLNGYTSGGRPEIFSHFNYDSPNNELSAPSMVSYLGWPSTFGDSQLVQYAIVDRHVVPVEHSKAWYTETLLILPTSFFVGDHVYKMKQFNDKNIEASTDTATTPVEYRHTLIRMSRTDGKASDNNNIASSASSSASSFIFCNFNQLFKLSVNEESTVLVWSQILRRVPGSLLWLLRHPSVAEPSVVRHMLSAGTPNRTLVFTDFVDKRTYLQRSTAAQLFLDNQRYNAGATGVDALYSGVPVLTIPTQRMVGRMGTSMGVSTSASGTVRKSLTVVHGMKFYEDLAVRIGKSKRISRGLQRHVNAQKKKMGGLFDMTTFAGNFARVLKMSKEMQSVGNKDEKKNKRIMHVVVV